MQDKKNLLTILLAVLAIVVLIISFINKNKEDFNFSYLKKDVTKQS